MHKYKRAVCLSFVFRPSKFKALSILSAFTIKKDEITKRTSQKSFLISMHVFSCDISYLQRYKCRHEHLGLKTIHIGEAVIKMLFIKFDFESYTVTETCMNIFLVISHSPTVIQQSFWSFGLLWNDDEEFWVINFRQRCLIEFQMPWGQGRILGLTNTKFEVVPSGGNLQTCFASASRQSSPFPKSPCVPGDCRIWFW